MANDSTPPVKVWQGTIAAWDASTGDNTISVAGGTLTNVSALKAGSATLAVGDVVNLLSVGNQWFLLGNVTTPGDPGTVPTWTADITALSGDVETINTVTIPAVQSDVTIVQGDVIELNTVTVPAVQATAEAAQDAADTAATDAAQAATDAAQAASDAAAAQAATTALQTDLDATDAAVTAAQGDVDTLTATTIPALQADVAAILPIGTTDITDDAVTTAKVAANAITATEIASGAVTTAKLDAGAVTAAKIAAGTITATEIQAGAITGTKLSADAIDGKTITGATLRTSASGQRIEIDSQGLVNWIRLYSGAAGETQPGYLYSTQLNWGETVLAGPQTGTAAASSLILGPEVYLTSSEDVVGISGEHITLDAPSFINLTTTTNWVSLDAGSFVQLDAGQHITLNATTDLNLNGATVKANSVPVATTSGTETLTNKDLSSSTNTFPSYPYYYAYLAASATVTTGTSTAVSWTDDNNLGHSGITRSGSVFTVPTAGRYRVTFQAYWAAIASPAGNRLAQLLTGNTIGTGTVLASAAEQPSATAASACLITKTIRLAASAQFRTQVSHTQGAVTYTGGLQGNVNGDLTYVQIEWVGP